MTAKQSNMTGAVWCDTRMTLRRKPRLRRDSRESGLKVRGVSPKSVSDDSGWNRHCRWNRPPVITNRRHGGALGVVEDWRP
jgi:hypothetical protein